jgi:hypothetical protein
MFFSLSAYSGKVRESELAQKDPCKIRRGWKSFLAILFAELVFDNQS